MNNEPLTASQIQARWIEDGPRLEADFQKAMQPIREFLLGPIIKRTLEIIAKKAK